MWPSSVAPGWFLWYQANWSHFFLIILTNKWFPYGYTAALRSALSSTAASLSSDFTNHRCDLCSSSFKMFFSTTFLPARQRFPTMLPVLNMPRTVHKPDLAASASQTPFPWPQDEPSQRNEKLLTASVSYSWASPIQESSSVKLNQKPKQIWVWLGYRTLNFAGIQKSLRFGLNRRGV